MINFLILCFQGAIIGIASILPGASGSVLCVAFGIYEPMMAMLAHPIKNLKRYYKMFIPFLIGCVCGFLLLAHVVALLFEMFPEIAMALFAGLICGTIPNLIKKSHYSNPVQSWSPFMISMVTVFTLFAFLQTEAINTVTPSVLLYVFCGMIWGLSLVVPGSSTTSILIFLGLYQPMISGIGELDFAVITPWLVGLIITVLLCARLVNRLFEKQYGYITKIVLGLMIPSTLMILPYTFASAFVLFLSVLCFTAGFVLSNKMENKNVFTGLIVEKS